MWCDKGSIQAQDPLVVEQMRFGKAVKRKGMAFQSWKKAKQGLDRTLEDDLKTSYSQIKSKTRKVVLLKSTIRKCQDNRRHGQREREVYL